MNGINTTIGIPQYCGEGTYLRICNDGTNSANAGRLLCNGFGFLCKFNYDVYGHYGVLILVMC